MNITFENNVEGNCDRLWYIQYVILYDENSIFGNLHVILESKVRLLIKLMLSFLN